MAPAENIGHIPGECAYSMYFSLGQCVMTQGETQMQTQEADGWSLTIFINPIGEGKRMVVDRQKGQHQFRVQKVPKGRQDDQAGGKGVQSQAGVKTVRTIKKRIAKGLGEKHAG